MNNFVPGCHFTVSLSKCCFLHLCHYLDEKPEEAKVEDSDDEDGSAETSEPGRAGGLDRNYTFFLGQIDLHLGPTHAQAVPAGKKN